MKNFKLLITIITLFCFISMNFINCLACDISLDAVEEDHLLYENFLETSCKGSQYKNSKNCKKLLIRYDGLESKIDEIKELIEEWKKEGKEVSNRETYEKIGIITTSVAAFGVGLHFYPIFTVLTGLGVPAVNFIISMCKDDDVGLLERVRKLIFGKKKFDSRNDNEVKAYQKLLNNFYKQVKKGKFKEDDNNVLVMCVDSTDANNVKSDLKFKHTHLVLPSDTDDNDDYFKDWL